MSQRNVEVADSAHCREICREFAESLIEGNQASGAEKNVRKIYAVLITDLIAFVEAAIGTDERPFVLMMKPGGEKDYHASALAKRCFPRIPTFVRLVAQLSRRYRYSEHIEVFREGCAALGLWNPTDIREDNWQPLTFLSACGVDGATAFNALCSLIRRDWEAKGYKAQFRRRQQETRARSKDYQRYIDAWFSKLAKLIVLRIDLSYRTDCREAITVNDLNADYERLTNNARHNKIFKGWRGHIAKIEYGLGKGLHMHMIFLFDTEHKQAIRHVYLAQQIGEYWSKVVTKGRGEYWNCNADTKKYQRWGKQGIGPIHVVEDEENVRNLKLYVVDYLCKMDQFLRPQGVQGVQLIRRGNWPKSVPKKRGAPRKVRSASLPTNQPADASDTAREDT